MAHVEIKKCENGFIITKIKDGAAVHQSVCEAPFDTEFADALKNYDKCYLMAFEALIYRLSEALGVDLTDSEGNHLKIALEACEIPQETN